MARRGREPEILLKDNRWVDFARFSELESLRVRPVVDRLWIRTVRSTVDLTLYPGTAL
jgi:hypothetical protein